MGDPATLPAPATSWMPSVGVRLLSIQDAAAWRAALPASTSAFGSLEFAQIQRGAGHGTPCLVVVDAGATCVAYPLLLRPVGDLPWLNVAAGHRDATTPPFTGPVASGDGDIDAVAVTDAFARALRDLELVAEFAHLHPWRACLSVLPAALVETRHPMVYVDLTWDAERLWSASYDSTCRKNVRHAQRAGVTVREGTSVADIEEFHRIFTMTMQRRDALECYRHPLSYFLAFRDLMPENARFVLAEVDGTVVAAALYLHDDGTVYSYLGGADHGYQSVRPTNAVVHETVQWGREHSKQRLVLGGGYRAGDGIMRFKATFSPLRADLPVLRRVHDQAAYERLAGRWREARTRGGLTAEADGFFPVYRAPVVRPDPTVTGEVAD